MKTITLEEARRDLEWYFHEAAEDGPFAVVRGDITIGSLGSPPTDLPTLEEHLRNLEAKGKIIRANPNASRRITRRSEGKGTAASDWIIDGEREDRA